MEDPKRTIQINIGVFRVNREGALSGDGRTQFGRAMAEAAATIEFFYLSKVAFFNNQTSLDRFAQKQALALPLTYIIHPPLESCLSFPITRPDCIVL